MGRNSSQATLNVEHLLISACTASHHTNRLTVWETQHKPIHTTPWFRQINVEIREKWRLTEQYTGRGGGCLIITSTSTLSTSSSSELDVLCSQAHIDRWYLHTFALRKANPEDKKGWWLLKQAHFYTHRSSMWRHRTAVCQLIGVFPRRLQKPVTQRGIPIASWRSIEFPWEGTLNRCCFKVF